MNLVKLTVEDGVLFINPEHVVMVKKGIKDTNIQTVIAAYTVKEPPEMVVRLLGADEIARDITPSMPMLLEF